MHAVDADQVETEQVNPQAREAIRGAGLDLGFSVVGFAPAEEPTGSRRLLDWLDLGYEGPMAWMARDPQARLDPERFLSGVRTVVVVALRYKHPPLPPAPALPVTI